MPLGDSENQLNGEASVEMEEKKCLNESLKFNPLPQRVMRLNRRGFYMSGRDKQDIKESTDNTNVQRISQKNSLKCIKSATTIDDKSLTSSGSRIIKLSNSKKNSVRETENCVKRAVNGDRNLTSDTSSQKISVPESPPKKKHKPITWP